MELKFGVMNNPIKEVLAQLEQILGLGFDYVELSVEWPGATAEEVGRKIEQMKQVLSSHDAFVVLHAPWYLEIASPYEGVRKGALAEARKIISLASTLDASLVTFHPFSPGWLATVKEEARRLNAMAFYELVNSGREFNVAINFENTDVGVFSSIASVNFMFSEVRDLNLTLDIGHAFLGGRDEKIRSYFKHLEEKITHVHAHDNFGFRDLHLPVGAGRVNWDLVSGLLKYIGYDGTVTMEPHSGDPEYCEFSRKKFIEYWEHSREEEP